MTDGAKTKVDVYIFDIPLWVTEVEKAAGLSLLTLLLDLDVDLEHLPVMSILITLTCRI